MLCLSCRPDPVSSAEDREPRPDFLSSFFVKLCLGVTVVFVCLRVDTAGGLTADTVFSESENTSL